MAKTIGKEKSSLTRARSGAAAEGVSVDDTSADEPRNEDMVVADETELNDPSIVEDEDDDDRELALPATTTVVRKTSGSRSVTLPSWASRYAATRFVGESAIELWKNVTWPTRAEAWNMTLIVIAMSAFIAVILGIADLGLIHVLQWIVSLGSK